MIVHKSRKKAVCITVAGFLAGIAGGLILYYVRDAVLGWCFVATAGFTLLYGIGSLYDRRYESKGVKAVYLRTMGLEMDSMQLVALIRRMKEADVPGRIELLNGCLLK